MLNRKLLMTTAMTLLSAASLTATAAAAQTRPQTPPTQAQTPPARTPPAEEQETAVEEVVVRGDRPDIISASDRMIYNVSNDLQAQTGTIADALRNVPGVEVDLQGNVSLRGDSNVTILIDGRPSGVLSGGSRGDALQAMSAAGYERVEVITNPSAAFSPEGSGGIINLVSKPTRQATSNGTVRSQWDGGERGGVSFSGSRTAGDLTLAGDIGYRRDNREIAVEQNRVRPGATAALTTVEEATSQGLNVHEMGQARLAVDYNLNATDRLSGEISMRGINGENEGLETFERANGLGVASYAYERLSDTGFENSGVSARSSWRRKFSGDQHELVADVEFDHNEGERSLDAFTDIQVGAGTDFYERILNDSSRDAYGFKVDYTRPMGDRQTLKIGYEGDLTMDDFDSFGSRGSTTGTMLPVAALTNQFEYDQTIHAAYFTYDRPYGEKLMAQLGVRVEQVNFELNQITDGIVIERDYLRAYPTLHLAYDLTDTQKLRGSYSRRIQRPSPQDLNPYTIYVDPQNLRRGNPDLDPEITDSFELTWQLRSQGTFYSLTGFYRTSEGGVTDVAQDLGGGVVLVTRENLASSDRIGAEFLANGKFHPTLSYNISGAWYRHEIATPGYADQTGTTGTVRASLNWQPTPEDFFQLNGFYIGEQVQAQGAREPFGTLNVGYRRKVTDNLSLMVTGQNILDSAEQKVRIDTTTFNDRTRVQFGEPVWFVGFSYSFGAGQRRPEGFDFGSPTGPG
jgi:outer membrane receptor protein involved in Fe transport